MFAVCQKTYTTRKPITVRSKISSSYRSDSSGLKGASKARTELRRPEPLDAGSTRTGCISERVRTAPIGSADEGAMLSKGVASMISHVLMQAETLPTRANSIDRQFPEFNDA